MLCDNKWVFIYFTLEFAAPASLSVLRNKLWIWKKLAKICAQLWDFSISMCQFDYCISAYQVAFTQKNSVLNTWGLPLTVVAGWAATCPVMSLCMQTKKSLFCDLPECTFSRFLGHLHFSHWSDYLYDTTECELENPAYKFAVTRHVSLGLEEKIE